VNAFKQATFTANHRMLTVPNIADDVKSTCGQRERVASVVA
jgi:hypothetical protein